MELREPQPPKWMNEADRRSFKRGVDQTQRELRALLVGLGLRRDVEEEEKANA